MKKIIWLLPILMFAVSLNEDVLAEEVRPFPIESGIIEYEITERSWENSAAGKGKEVLYFVDWGRKAAFYTIEGSAGEENKDQIEKCDSIFDYPWVYFIDADHKTAEKISVPESFWSAAETHKEMFLAGWSLKRGKKILGRECMEWTIDKDGGHLEQCLWQNSPLFLSLISSHKTRIATSIKEGVAIPREKYELPPDIKVVAEKSSCRLICDLLARLSPANYLEQPHVKLFENDAFAFRALRELSMASETYVLANNGRYPEGVEELLSAPIPYIGRNVCDNKEHGYVFECDFSGDGYTITATPIMDGVTGSTTVTITTGGVLSPQTYKKLSEYTEEDKRILREKTGE